MYIYIYIRVAIITITLMITLLWTIMRPRCLPCNTVLTFLQHSIRLNGVTLHLLGSLATHPSLAMWKFSEYLSLSLYKKNPPKTADVAKDRLGRSTSFVIFRRKRRAAHSSVPFILCYRDSPTKGEAIPLDCNSILYKTRFLESEKETAK